MFIYIFLSYFHLTSIIKKHPITLERQINHFYNQIYQSGEENISTNVLCKDEIFWMTQKDMTTLFSVQIPAINKHLKNIFAEQELLEYTQKPAVPRFCWLSGL